VQLSELKSYVIEVPFFIYPKRGAVFSSFMHIQKEAASAVIAAEIPIVYDSRRNETLPSKRIYDTHTAVMKMQV
jgi:hypothetical protein